MKRFLAFIRTLLVVLLGAGVFMLTLAFLLLAALPVILALAVAGVLVFAWMLWDGTL